MAKYKGRGEYTEPWEDAFLEHYRTKGGKVLSAKEAGTTWPKVKAHMEASDRFRAAYDLAHLELCDMLERKLVEMAGGAKGNFLAIIARLKAELPNKYNDKLQVSGAVAHVHSATDPAVVSAILREMLADARPETLAALAAPVEVIETTAERIDA